MTHHHTWAHTVGTLTLLLAALAGSAAVGSVAASVAAPGALRAGVIAAPASPGSATLSGDIDWP